MPCETTSPQPANTPDFHYVAPPQRHNDEEYRAYIERHLDLNRGVLTDPALFATGGFHIRQCGRSTLIGLALLEQARQQPGQLVPYRDHFHGTDERAKYLMMEIVSSIVRACPRYQYPGLVVGQQGVCEAAPDTSVAAYERSGLSLAEFNALSMRPGAPVVGSYARLGKLLRIENGEAYIDLGEDRGFKATLDSITHAGWPTQMQAAPLA